MQADQYVIANDWYITASKLKVFAKNPEEYKLQYIDKINIPTDARHFVLWTAFDDLVTYRIKYGNNQKYTYETEQGLSDNPFFDIAMWLQIQLKENTVVDETQLRMKVRLSKYYMDEWLVTDWLKAELIKRPIDKRYWLTDIAIKKMKLPELRKVYYRDPSNVKVRLTPWEAQKVMWMYREVLRQPNMDMFARRWTQTKIETKYNGAKIRWTLDRFALVDKDNNRYLPEEVDEFVEIQGRAKRQELVKSEQITGIIRDRKTCWNMDRFEYDMEETFDYVLSMSFYYILAFAKYGVKSSVYLDVLNKQEPYWSYIYRLRPDRIVDKIQNTIKPLIDDLIKAYEHNIWDPIKPLTGQPVSRNEMMKSKYYPYMTWAVQENVIEPWYQ